MDVLGLDNVKTNSAVFKYETIYFQKKKEFYDNEKNKDIHKGEQETPEKKITVNIEDIGEKPFKCDVCDKAYSASSSLKTHNLSHTQEKPFKCDLCDKAYSAFSSLKTQKLSHTGEKPYKCDICKNAFSQYGNFN